MALTERKVLTPRGCTFFRTSNTLNLTSSLENGLPSWNFTPSLSLKVTLSPSGAISQDFASPGIGLRSKPYSSKPSNTLVATCPTGPEVLW